LEAERLGEDHPLPCPRCGEKDGRKLDSGRLKTLAQHFCVWGSVYKLSYGAAPRIQFNDRRKTDMDLLGSLSVDVTVFEEALGTAFSFMNTRLWMVGEIEPLKALQCDEMRPAVIDRILSEYGAITLSDRDKFYRIRKKPESTVSKTPV